MSETNPSEKRPNKTLKPPSTWGVSSAAFYAYHRLKPVRVVTLDNKAITGSLIGVDTFDIILEMQDKTAILIPKHSVKYITPALGAEEKV